MSAQEKYSELITKYLESHPAISATRIEQDLQLPGSTIRQAKGERNIPAKHIFSVLCYLAGHELTIEDYSLSYDPADDTLVARKWIRNVKDKEVKDKGGSYFIYTVEELRWTASEFAYLP